MAYGKGRRRYKGRSRKGNRTRTKKFITIPRGGYRL